MYIKNLIYKFLDALTLRKGFSCYVNGYKIYFPAKWFRYFEKDYEKDNVAFLSKHCGEGMVVLDVGAHLGLMSVICAKLVGQTGKVYAFEPTPSTFEVLKKVVLLNKVKLILEPQNMAVSNFDGSLDFFVEEYDGSNANSLVSRNDRNRTAKKTKVITLDTFAGQKTFTRLDLIKIDAEGSELDVLRGATNSLQKFRPKIILALHPPLITNNGQEQGDIYDLIGELKYDVFFNSKPLSRSDFCEVQDLFDVHLMPKTL